MTDAEIADRIEAALTGIHVTSRGERRNRRWVIGVLVAALVNLGFFAYTVLAECPWSFLLVSGVAATANLIILGAFADVTNQCQQLRGSWERALEHWMAAEALRKWAAQQRRWRW